MFSLELAVKRALCRSCVIERCAAREDEIAGQAAGGVLDGIEQHFGKSCWRDALRLAVKIGCDLDPEVGAAFFKDG